VHEVALVDDHASVEDCPEVIEAGLAVRLAVEDGIIASTSTPSTLALVSELPDAAAKEMAIFPLASAFAVNVFTIALCCAPVAAKMSKLERT
jgi:hypothetical protein